MKYFSERILKDGRSRVLRNAEETDAEDFLSYSTKAHGETGFFGYLSG